MPFDLEVTEWNGPPEPLAEILGIGEVEAETLALTVPAMAARQVSDEEAERLFHELSEAGATVRLHPCAPRPSSRAPAAAATPSPTAFADSERPLAEAAPSPSGSGSERVSAPSGSGEITNQLDWTNTKVYWLWFGVAFIGLGIWMLVDPDAMSDPDATRRRARGIKKLIEIGWSRPLGVILVLGGLFGSYTGMRDAKDLT